MEEFVKHLAHSLGSWAYLLVAFMAMAETAAFLGFIAPGEFTIILGGVLAGEGTLSIALLIGIVWASIVTGDSIGFLLGRKLGRRFAQKHGPRIRLTEERLERVESYFRRHGGKTIFIGRWIGFVRPLMPFTAGTSGVPYRRFIPYDVLSAGLFGTCFSMLGYIFWKSFDKVTAIAGKGAFGLGIAAALVAAAVIAFRHLRRPEQRRRVSAALERLGRRPALRPIFAVSRLLRPPLRFAGRRLTPGGLGIELTSLLAIAAVCGYVFGLYTHLVADGSSVTTPGDDAASDVSGDVRGGALTAVLKVVTFLGSRGLTAAIVAVAAAALAARRHRIQAAALAIGFTLVQVGVILTKELVDRPRPAHPLVHVTGSSFPSGHAADAIAYVALAVAVAGVVRRARWRVALVTAAVAVAALVGLSRVYLRVHYLSDVTSGWALSLAVFSLCGCALVIVSFLRDNARPS